MKIDTGKLLELREAENELKKAERSLHGAVLAAFQPGVVVKAKLASRVHEFPVKEVQGRVLILETGNGKTIARAYDSVEV